MIYYTYQSSTDVVIGQFVQLSTDSQQVINHTSGDTLGVCMNTYTSEDDGNTYAEIYVAGGGGVQATLNADWDGSPTRFSVVNSKVQPVTTGGIGWIIPNLPKTNKLAGESVYISIY